MKKEAVHKQLEAAVNHLPAGGVITQKATYVPHLQQLVVHEEQVNRVAILQENLAIQAANRVKKVQDWHGLPMRIPDYDMARLRELYPELVNGTREDKLKRWTKIYNAHKEYRLA